jgi:hypothetical protein
MKYYVITDLGYDGMMMEEFEEETKALKRYLEMNKDDNMVIMDIMDIREKKNT